MKKNEDMVSASLYETLLNRKKTVSSHWKLFQWLEKTFIKSFQRLEKWLQKFPMIGKIKQKVSNDWKPLARPGFKRSFARWQRIVFVLALLAGLCEAGYGDTVWSEDFSSVAEHKGNYEGTTDMAGITKWTIDTSGATIASGDWFSKEGGDFEGVDLDGPAVWTTESIDISGYTDVSFSLLADEQGDHEATDYFNVEYRVGSGSWTLIENWNSYGDTEHTLKGDLPDDSDWGSTTVTQWIGGAGSSLQVRVTMQNNAGSEELHLDDVLVEGTLSVVDPEPDNHVTGLAVLDNAGGVKLDWTDATGDNLPAGYLIKVSSSGLGAISDPSDETAEADDTDLTDGSGCVSVAQGTETFTFDTYAVNTSYYFKVYPYSNSGDDIDYKTDGTVPAGTGSCSRVKNLQPGDVLFAAYQFDNPDTFAVVSLVNVAPDVEIHFTDEGWSNGVWITSEDSMTWTTPLTGVDQGTVITFLDDGDSDATVSAGSCSGVLDSLTLSGEQILMYQGDSGSPSFVAGMSSDDWLVDEGEVDNTCSYLPSTLVLGDSAIGFDAERDNGFYESALTNASKTALRTALCNASGWDRDDSLQSWPTGWDFVIGGASPLLSAGDVLITAFDTTDNSDDILDRFAFVAMTDIVAGTEIFFTQNGWTGSGFRYDEETVVWQAPAEGIEAGTVIEIADPVSGHDAVVTGGGTAGGAPANFGNDGDSILAYQRTVTNSLFIAGLNTRVWAESGNIGDQDSYLPSGLTDGQNAVDFGLGTPNCGYFSADTADTQAHLQRALGDENNWTTVGTVNQTWPSNWRFTFIEASALNFSLIGCISMDLNWTAGNGVKRIVVLSQGDAVAWEPTDAVTYSANSDYSAATDQGSGDKVVYQGDGESVSLSGLSVDTTYYAKIYEYNETGGNTDYLLNGTPAAASQATAPPDAFSTITAAAAPIAAGSVSSVADTMEEAVDVLKFSVNDNSNSDGLGLDVTQLTFVPGANNTADWSDTVQGVTLNDGSPVALSGVTVSDESIVVTMDAGSLTVANNGSSDVVLAVYLNTSNIEDNDVLAVEVDADSPGVTCSSQSSQFAATFAGGDITSADQTIEVTATQADVTAFENYPGGTYEDNETFDLTIQAQDANGNADVDSTATFSVARGDVGSGSLVGASAQALTDGEYTWSGLRFDGVGEFNILVTGDGMSDVQSTLTLVCNDDDDTIPAIASSSTYVTFDGHSGSDLDPVTDSDLEDGLTFITRAYDAQNGLASYSYELTDNEGASRGDGAFDSGPSTPGGALETAYSRVGDITENFAQAVFDGAPLGVWTCAVTVVDADNDRTDDGATGVREYEITVEDDDSEGPWVTNLYLFGARAVLIDCGFETENGWSTKTDDESWEQTDSYGTWYGTNAYVSALNARGNTGRKLGFNTANDSLVLPAANNPGVLLLWAKLSAAGSETLRLNIEEEGRWVSLGDVTIDTSEYALYSWDISRITNGCRLQLVMPSLTTRSIYVDDLTLIANLGWTNAANLDVDWCDGDDTTFGDSGIAGYRYSAINGDVPTLITDGSSAGTTTGATVSVGSGEGVVTGFVFAIDADEDRGTTDRAMGRVLPYTMLVDRTPPDQVVGTAGDTGSDDPTSEAELSWTACGSPGGVDLSPWVGYRIYIHRRKP